MNRTLNQLIEAAVLGGEEVEQSAPRTPEVQVEKTASASTTSATDLGDVEKLASALEFIGRRGVASFLEKEASSHGGGSVGTNAGTHFSNHTQKQTGPHKGAPPMSPGKMSGQVENNMGQKPGSGAAQAETGSTERGSHAPELASNESAINYDKKSKTKRTSTALKKVLDETPYADGKLKENLSNAAGKGDKNIHKSAHDLAAVRAELERRAAGRA